jgi:hypothetical protein
MRAAKLEGDCAKAADHDNANDSTMQEENFFILTSLDPEHGISVQSHFTR